MSTPSPALSGPWPLTRYRQRENNLLSQRLLALEERLQALEQDRAPNGSSAQGAGHAEVRATSTPAQEGLQPRTARISERPSRQDDVVDGMGSVALTDGADEHEYFGKASPPKADCNPSHLGMR